MNTQDIETRKAQAPDGDDAYVYEPFAQTVEYLKINETIVRRWVEAMIEGGSKHIDRIVDLATGVGTMARLLIENLPPNIKPVDVVCVDMSGRALEQAGENLKARVNHLTLVKTPLQELSLEPESVDVAIWGNGVHYLSSEDQIKTFSNIRRALKPGGWFCFNSAFYEEARPAKTLSFYRSQVATAVRNLRSRGFSRDKSEHAPESALYLPLAHYQDLLAQAGFQVEEIRNFVARMYRSAWEKISAFSQYASGALHGYPTEAAAEALEAAVAPSLEQYGERDENDEPFIPRNWFSAIARAK
ncbi:MAG: class I SAM-dependent methyltransferase [Spirochaetaceae bacterium]|nr:MAG: class I SAM-dependent methyltransferase [Spirochaetaceae bacterium]